MLANAGESGYFAVAPVHTSANLYSQRCFSNSNAHSKPTAAKATHFDELCATRLGF